MSKCSELGYFETLSTPIKKDLLIEELLEIHKRGKEKEVVELITGGLFE